MIFPPLDLFLGVNYLYFTLFQGTFMPTYALPTAEKTLKSTAMIKAKAAASSSQEISLKLPQNHVSVVVAPGEMFRDDNIQKAFICTVALVIFQSPLEDWQQTNATTLEMLKPAAVPRLSCTRQGSEPSNLLPVVSEQRSESSRGSTVSVSSFSFIFFNAFV